MEAQEGPKFELITDRLTLLPLETEDLPFFHRINTHPQVRKFLWDDKKIEWTEAQEILTEVHQQFEQQNWGLWKIVENFSGDLLGYAGLWFFFNEDQPQLIYALLPEFQGQGYATEASEAIIKYAFEELEFDYLVASTDTPNTASKKVCERLGMQLKEQKKVEGKPTLFYTIEHHPVDQ